MTAKKPIALDATNRPLGRLAAEIARLLMGKHQPNYRPHLQPAQRVMVKNCANIYVDKKKLVQKVFYRTSGHPGRVRTQTLGNIVARDPREALKRAVWGMLPKNSLRETMIKNLDLKN